MTAFPGVVPLANLAQALGLFEDLDALLPERERDRGFAHSAAVFDLMCIPLSGGQCLDDLAQLRADARGCGSHVQVGGAAAATNCNRY